MARLRFTLEEARGEAERLAIEYVKKMPNTEKARMIHGAAPSLSEPKSSASKFPVIWSVAFVFHPPDVVMDGGELIVRVNIETKEVCLPWS